MKLKDLMKEFSHLKVVGSKEVEITGISADSRTTAPGNLFIAKKGGALDGADFILQAIEAGALAVATSIYNPFVKATQIIHSNPQELEAQIAARYYRYPSRGLWIAGVTGSKGKTTTCYLLRHLLESLERPCGLLSSVEVVIRDTRLASALTTHDSIFNQKRLHEMVEKGCKAAVIEVSSHGLAQNRVDEIEFDLALFTNLYPDHLDYHKTVESYAIEKRKLFRMAPFGIYNADSPWTPFMREDRPGLTFGVHADATVRAEQPCFDADGISFTVQGEPFRVPLISPCNLPNVLGAIAAGVYLGIPLMRLSSIFSQIEQIPGRLEPIPNDLGIRVLVDYAHSGAALDIVLQALRDIAPRRIIVVFGSGGEKPPARRPEMGAAASKWADVAIVTSDNARGEDPEEICRQILNGFSDPTKAIVDIDRKAAIQKAVNIAERGDLILIAGKGHETVQIQAGQRLAFDDRSVVKQALQIRQGFEILAR